jgi:nucleotide-binding universal stress UspA family protein
MCKDSPSSLEKDPSMHSTVSADGSSKNPPHGPFQRILVGLDISSQSSEIVRMVSLLAKVFNSTIIVCNVANVVTSVEGNEMDGFPVTKEERKTHDEMEEMIHNEFGSDAKRVEIKILHGDPAERIVEYADYSISDLIVIGSRSQGALKRALLGSVSGAVVAKTKKSVLIVK